MTRVDDDMTPLSTDGTDPTTSATDSVIDMDTLLEHFEGDVELLHEVAQLFLDDCPRRVSEVRTALAQGDSHALRQAAHSLKGSMANFAAAAATDAALQVETLAQAGDLTHATSACARLEEEVARLERSLSALRRAAD